MRTHTFRGWILLAMSLLMLNGCGYTFPHVYDGPHRTIYMPAWKNRTNKLGVDMKIYQSLSRWFQKSSSVALTRDNGTTDLILTGEIISIDLPSVSWNSISEVTGTKVNLVIRYALKDQKSGKVIWEVPNKLYSADYSGATASAAADDEALTKITDDLSEEIYLGALKRIRKQQQNQAAR